VEAGFDGNCAGARARNPCSSNNLGTASPENIWTQPEPGHKRRADGWISTSSRGRRSHRAALRQRGACRGGVMDVPHGDVLAMVSMPGVRPERFCTGHLAVEMAEDYRANGEKKPCDV